MNLPPAGLRLIIIAGAIILFVPYLGGAHLFDWDEINFAECAREMVITGNYSSVTINYQPFWEKPPLFFWMQALCMNIFGINEFAARLPNAICGIVTLLFLFNAGTTLYNQRFGLLWVLAYAGSLLPHFYFKSGIIDPWFNLFIFSSLWYFNSFSFNEVTVHNSRSRLIASGILLGLAIMTKGPVAALIFGLCITIMWILNRKLVLSFKNILLFSFIVILAGSLWFISELIQGRSHIVVEFIEYQVRLFRTKDAGHGGPFFYHFIVLLIGCFPASVFAVAGFKKRSGDSALQAQFRQLMVILFWVVLILFSIVKTKIVHYSSLCYFPLTFLAAYAVYKNVWKKYMIILLAIIGVAIALLIAAVPFIEVFKESILSSGIIKDKFAAANLEADVKWSGYEFLTGILLLGAVILALLHLKKRETEKAFIVISLVSLAATNLIILLYVPKIEQYSQRAAIEFYKGLAGKDVYVETIGFKSYAQYFYSGKKPAANPESYNKEWLLTGNIDKPAFFVSKITEAENISAQYPQLKELYRKNGFVFYERAMP